MESVIKLKLALVAAAIVLSGVWLLLFGPVYTVNAGEGAVLLTWGNPSPNAVGPGLHFKVPFMQSVAIFDTKTTKYEADASAASYDLQTVTAKIAVNYHLQFERLPEIYSELGYNYAEKVIQPAVQEVVKASTAKFRADQLITNRTAVKDAIEIGLTQRLAPYGIVVEKNGVSITDFAFSREFADAIEQKVTSVQLRQKAENDLQTEKVKAEIRTAQGKGEADALALLRLQTTPEVIRLKEIEVQKAAVDKWDGRMPTFVGGSGALPFIDISKAANTEASSP